MVDQQEFDSVRARIHKLADQVQAHEVKMGEHGVLITVLNEHYQRAATKENLEAAIAATRSHIDLAVATQNTHIDAKVMAVKSDIGKLTERLDPIARGITGLIWLVIIAVVGALLGLVILGPPGTR
jgi:hypothetical protein